MSNRVINSQIDELDEEIQERTTSPTGERIFSKQESSCLASSRSMVVGSLLLYFFTPRDSVFKVKSNTDDRVFFGALRASFSSPRRSSSFRGPQLKRTLMMMVLFLLLLLPCSAAALSYEWRMAEWRKGEHLSIPFWLQLHIRFLFVLLSTWPLTTKRWWR